MIVDLIRFGFVKITYEVEITEPYANTKKLTFINNDMPDEDIICKGFNIVTGKGNVCGKYSEFSSIFANKEDCEDLGDNEIIVTNQSGYTYTQYLEENNKVNNTDGDEGFIGSTIHTEPYVPTLSEVKESKIKELSTVCKNIIENGVQIDDEHFSYSTEDQINMKNLFDTAMQTGQPVPYHSNNNICRMYTVEEFTNIYVAEQTNLIKNTTYFNMMKTYINSIEDDEKIDEIKAIVYGSDLPEEYATEFEDIMSNAAELINLVQTTALAE